MNFKKLAFWTTLFTTAAVPLATAQNPVILQGNYVSNVFGQSNFVLNPNAQTNVANVTNATRPSPAVTPLVATSEFNLSLTAGQFATWTLRAFDSGMKGQNCEARFTYRGFATATTKAELVQNSLVVASLTLTPSTDPRIASINFPCGDLTNLTTFRIAQTTANMTGTNEIGGIYVGLATNQANVAQAEYVGSVKYTQTANCAWSKTGTTTLATMSADSDCPTPTVTGSATTNAGKIAGAEFNLKPGRYQFIATFSFRKEGTNDLSAKAALSDGTTQGGQQLFTISTTTGVTAPMTLIMDVEYTTATTKTIQVLAAPGNTGDTAYIYNDGGGWEFRLYAYRFPTSSELVVTPERQNVWGGVVHRTVNQQIRQGQAASATFYEFNQASWNIPANLRGKAAVTTTNSGNDLGFSIPNLPVGSYRIDVSGLIQADTNGATTAGANVHCNFRIYETTTTTEVSKQSHRDQVVSAGTVIRDWTNSFSGIFTNTSVATRNFRLEAAKFADATSGNVGACQAYSNSSGIETQLTITITPLDQPSNSALYVQGPVQGSNTNTAIPTNSIGGKVIDASLAKTTTGLGTWQVASGNFGTPPAGSYLMIMNSVGTQTAGLTGTGSIINESGSSVTPVVCQLNSVNGSAVDTVYGRVCYYTTDGTKTLYAWAQVTGANTTVTTGLILVRLN